VNLRLRHFQGNFIGKASHESKQAAAAKYVTKEAKVCGTFSKPTCAVYVLLLLLLACLLACLFIVTQCVCGQRFRLFPFRWYANFSKKKQ